MSSRSYSLPQQVSHSGSTVPVTLSIILGVIAVTVFVATEAFAAAAVGAWAISGLFHLGQTIAVGLLAVFGLVAAAATIKTALLAWAAERHPDNN
ncbi:MAG: hypothetical protein H6890_08280 [Brucellaceae bacterium]|nr:hypothetical protein [Brucellaceae bacterium]